MIVVDASAIVDTLLELPPKPELDELLSLEDVHAPALLDYEVASALRGVVLAGRLDQADVEQTIRKFEQFAIERHPPLGSLISILDLRSNFTSYDAAYLVLARSLDAPLLTTDSKMLEARKLGVEVRVFT